MNWKTPSAIMAIIIIVVVGAYYAGTRTTSSPLTIYTADAYTGETEFLASGFHNATHNPIPLITASGAFTLAQEIGSGEGVDVFISVALSAVTQTYLHNYAPGWAVAFAADQMVVAYTNTSTQSVYAMYVLRNYTLAVENPNNTANWYGFFYALSSGDVRVGISNPNADPAGFRAWIVLEAAGYLYAHNTTFFTKTMISHHANYTADNAAQLVAPLTTGQINFLFIYKSAAIAKHLNYLELPPQVNLGDPNYTNFYAEFNYTLTTGVVKGSPIYLYITVPLTSHNPSEAFAFVEYVVEHSDSLATFGLAPLRPAYLYNSTEPPTQIAQLIMQGYIEYVGSL
ncbi:MAG: extracellular solute-binding protein [Thermoprotei archaeon]